MPVKILLIKVSISINNEATSKLRRKKKTDGADTGGPHIAVGFRPCFTNQNFYLQGKDEIQNQH